jgi:hypothetical protein
VSQFVREVLTEGKTPADARAAGIVYSATRFTAVPLIVSIVAVMLNKGEFVCIGFAFVLICQLARRL